MIKIDTTWSNVKSMLVSRTLLAQWVQVDSIYFISAIDQDFALNCRIAISPTPDPIIDADQIDFETNFKAKGNVKLSAQSDSDNASFSRAKQAPTGWTYQLRAVEFTTSKLGSLVNSDALNKPLSDVTVKYFDTNGVDISASGQTIIDTTCVQTQVDLEPTYDYYIIGGLAKILATPANDVRLSVIAVPDVPAAYGGSKTMIANVNFRYITQSDKIDADGRASKLLTYSPTTHSGKLRFNIFHPTGEKHSIAVLLEHYKI